MLDQFLAGGMIVTLLLALLASGLWVAFALIAISLVTIVSFASVPLADVMATSIWSTSIEWALVALPMFLWMGEILFRCRISEDLFDGFSPWTSWLPGRMLHINIVGSGLFAAVSGSSAATCATVGKIALPELRRRGYNERIALGSLAGSATLGLLIPPSIILIVYGVAAEESIARLFLAGVFPGLMLIGLFSGFVVIWALWRRDLQPAGDDDFGWAERWSALPRLMPILALIVGVVGSIYTGLASPTDAAAVGVALALLLAWAKGLLNRTLFIESLLAATRTSCMICFILAAAGLLTTAMGYSGLPRELALWVGSMDLNMFTLIAALTLLYMVLGCFLDGISIVVLTTAVILPIVDVAGIDRIWFGIYLVIVVEMSQITPPVGFNLFVIQNLTGANIIEVAVAAMPFFCLLLFSIVLIVVFPEVATWLPAQISFR